MNLREHIESLHGQLNNMRRVAERIDAERIEHARLSYRNHGVPGTSPVRWPGVVLGGLSVILHDGPLLCGAVESWHEQWHRSVRESNEPIALALLVEYDKRYAALQLGCELELDVSSVKLGAQNGEVLLTTADHDPPYNSPKKVR